MTENDFRRVVADNLIFYRKRAGLTQAEVAAHINYSDKSVSKWERGDGCPDAYVLSLLAEKYGVTISELTSKRSEETEETALVPDEIQIEPVEVEPVLSKVAHSPFTVMLTVGAVWLIATIIFSMTGAMCLMEVLKKVLRKPLHKCAQLMGIGDNAVAGMLASLVSVTLAFTQADDMDERGLIVVCAVCATVAHVIGGQFGVVVELAPDLLTPFVAGKFIAGAAGTAVALLLTRKK